MATCDIEINVVVSSGGGGGSGGVGVGDDGGGSGVSVTTVIYYIVIRRYFTSFFICTTRSWRDATEPRSANFRRKETANLTPISGRHGTVGTGEGCVYRGIFFFAFTTPNS